MPVLDLRYEGNAKDGKVNAVPFSPRDALKARGLILPVAVSVPPSVHDALARAGKPIPPPQQGLAIIDTGATATCVDYQTVLERLALKPSGVGTTHGVAGKTERPTFACTMEIHQGAIHPKLFLPHAMGVELLPLGYIALLGRDFLADKMLVYNGFSGAYQIAW